MPHLLKPTRLEPMLCNKRSHHNEKPVHRNEDPTQPKINKLKTKTKTHSRPRPLLWGDGGVSQLLPPRTTKNPGRRFSHKQKRTHRQRKTNNAQSRLHEESRNIQQTSEYNKKEAGTDIENKVGVTSVCGGEWQNRGRN